MTPVLESLDANHSIEKPVLIFFLYRKFKYKHIHLDKICPSGISWVKKLLKSSKSIPVPIYFKYLKHYLKCIMLEIRIKCYPTLTKL